MSTARAGGVLAVFLIVLTLSGPGARSQQDFHVRAQFHGGRADFGSEPPDLSIAAGPFSLVTFTNDGLTIRDKSTGAVIAREELNRLFDGRRVVDRERLIDPSIVFDASSGRFFAAVCGAFRDDPHCAPGACVAHNFIAVSKSANPRTTGAQDWHFYAFDATREGGVPRAEFADHARIGVSEDAVVLVSDPLRFADHGNQHPRIQVFPKAPLLAGEAPGFLDIAGMRDGDGRLAQQFFPAVHLRRPPDGTFFLLNAEGCGFGVWGLSTATGALTYRRARAGPGCAQPPDAPQPGGPHLAVSERATLLFWPHYTGSTIWTVSQVQQSYPSGAVSAIRVAAIDVSAWPASVAVVQDMTLAEEGVWKFFPALAADAAGNVGVVFGQSSASEFASAYVTGRLASDPPNQLRPARLLRAGTTAYRRNIFSGKVFYGDYFGSALDPLDGSAWLLGQFVDAPDRWNSWIANVAFAGSGGPPSSPPGDVRVTVAPTTIVVDFSPVSTDHAAGPAAATSYRLDFRQTPSAPVLASVSAPAPPVTIAIPPGATGSFVVTVTPINGAGAGPPSLPAAFTLGATGPQPCTSAPSAPVGVTGAVLGGVASVSWPAVPGASSYTLRAGSTSGSTNLFNGTVGAATSVSAAVGAGFQAFVRVHAVNPCGESAPSAELLLR